jgi:hypothetical protein
MMKRSSKLTGVFVGMMVLTGVLFGQSKTIYGETAGAHLIPVEKGLRDWKIKGNPFKNKWTTGQAALNPNNPKKLTVANRPSQPAELINAEKGDADIYTREEFGDCRVELEVMLPKGSNSGIYLMGQYEVQVKDSFGKNFFLGAKDMGAICGVSEPAVNASKKPGQWQHYLIEFKAPVFQGRKRVAPARFLKVVLNGKILHENVVMKKGPTSGALRRGEFAKGPLMLQGGMGAVAYRNIRISALED